MGNIITDDKLQNINGRVYAGGDIVLGSATVILAMGQGRIAAKSINNLPLRSKKQIGYFLKTTSAIRQFYFYILFYRKNFENLKRHNL